MSVPARTVKRQSKRHSVLLDQSGTKPAKRNRDEAQHGLKVQRKAKEDEEDVDVVFVPGLGAHPENSWRNDKGDFNWMSSDEGLAQDFPKARILLYRYVSAWWGSKKVSTTIKDIADSLLHDLHRLRKNRRRCPIVLIGHSMGGLVIAKALILADSRRDQFPRLFESITGCVFFGTPFKGASAASLANVLAQVGKQLDQAETTELLKLMEPESETLSELRSDFVHLATKKLHPPVELLCFYEQKDTKFSEKYMWPPMLEHFIPGQVKRIVTKQSAILDGAECKSLYTDHSGLVKYDGPKSDLFVKVRWQLKAIIDKAFTIHRERLNETRKFNWATFYRVRKALGGSNFQLERWKSQREQVSTSWLLEEKEYKEWLVDRSQRNRQKDYMWIKGGEGRGKTSSTQAILKSLEIESKDVEESESRPTVIFFFCKYMIDRPRAEDVLKSFLLQFVEQHPRLMTTYAESFQNGAENVHQLSTIAQNVARSILPLTIENMWQKLHEMLRDDFLESPVYLIINDLHLLPMDSASTQTFLSLIKADIADSTRQSRQDLRRAPVRWLLSSRDSDILERFMSSKEVRIIDLEEEKYEEHVKEELKFHARERIDGLRKEKSYDPDVAYFAQSLIGKRAQNKKWIDIACLQLRRLPEGESGLEVRKVLNSMPQDLDMLLAKACDQVLLENPIITDNIKEVLLALILTFEDPTISELCMLVGWPHGEEQKSALLRVVDHCEPLLARKFGGGDEEKIGFSDVVVQTYLLRNCKKILGIDKEELKIQHGMLAWRSFRYLKEYFTVNQSEDIEKISQEAALKGLQENEELGNEQDHWATPLSPAPSTNESIAAGTEMSRQDSLRDEISDDSDDEEQASGDEDEEEDQECSDDGIDEYDYVEEEEDPELLVYAVKYWLQHASKATKGIAEDLVLSDPKDFEGFWEKESGVRSRWLTEFQRLGCGFQSWSHENLSSLHVVAAVGFPRLITALVRNGHQSEIHSRDPRDNTPLHLAAYFNQLDIVDVLLDEKAPIDDGKDDGLKTPLHMAAHKGHVNVMSILIAYGADVNAFAIDIGSVLNAAISSGNQEAVELLIKHNVNLSAESMHSFLPPIAIAATVDRKMFDYFKEKCEGKVPVEQYDRALVAAASTGQAEIFDQLLSLQYSYHVYQQAIDAAASKPDWTIVKTILGQVGGLNCDRVFIEAARSSSPSEDTLRAIWHYTNAKIEKSVLNEALYEATDREYEDIVKLLLNDFRADPNATGEEFGNALTAAAFDGTIGIIEILLSHGADPNSPRGWALQTAAEQGHREVVELLLNAGAYVNLVADISRFEAGTALQAACESSNKDIVDLLLQRGADPNLGPGRKSCPLIAASKWGDVEITNLLLDHDAQVNVSGGEPLTTPLINAVSYLPMETLRRLLQLGADVDFGKKHGTTALIAAVIKGDPERVECLVNHGADIMRVNEKGKNALQIALMYDLGEGDDDVEDPDLDDESIVEHDDGDDEDEDGCEDDDDDDDDEDNNNDNFSYVKCLRILIDAVSRNCTHLRAAVKDKEAPSDLESREQTLTPNMISKFDGLSDTEHINGSAVDQKYISMDVPLPQSIMVPLQENSNIVTEAIDRNDIHVPSNDHGNVLGRKQENLETNHNCGKPHQFHTSHELLAQCPDQNAGHCATTGSSRADFNMGEVQKPIRNGSSNTAFIPTNSKATLSMSSQVQHDSGNSTFGDFWSSKHENNQLHGVQQNNRSASPLGTTAIHPFTPPKTPTNERSEDSYAHSALVQRSAGDRATMHSQSNRTSAANSNNSANPGRSQQTPSSIKRKPIDKFPSSTSDHNNVGHNQARMTEHNSQEPQAPYDQYGSPQHGYVTDQPERHHHRYVSRSPIPQQSNRHGNTAARQNLHYSAQLAPNDYPTSVAYGDQGNTRTSF